ncbi:MAG TPA: peptidylprolyl isomerase [Solirubrobacteraceae bacterium]|nr:peptidylprolyl isomerase [Solirubrobacteraceae bacterium]
MIVPRAAVAAVLACLLTLALAACGDDDKKASRGGKTTEAATTEAPQTTAAESSATGCQKVKAPKAKGEGDLSAPKTELDPAKTYTAVFTTSCGLFSVALDVKESPKTASSFASLVEKGFYDGLTFHRIVPGFVIQGGDPKGDGSGGPGYSVTEAPPRDAAYTRGVVAMAKTEAEDPGTSGSQFYVVTGADAQLPPDYAIVGKVSKGQDVVNRIGVLPTDPSTEQPLEPVVIEKVAIQQS